MNKLNAAESIRGLACLAVVFSHLSLSFYPYLHHFDANDSTDSSLIYAIHHSPFAFWYSGTAAVFVFFVLSGFVLTYAIMKNPNSIKQKIKNMLLKRYPRLMIPALTSCIFIWACFSFIDIESHQVGGWLQAYVNQDFSFKHAVYEGTIGSFFFAESETNWVLWTMTIELFGSLVLFILMYLYQLKKTFFWIGSVVLLCLAYYWRGEGFCMGISSFVIGIYMYLYAKKINTAFAICIFLLGLYLAGAHNTSMAYSWIYQLLGERTYEYCNYFSGILIVYSVLMNTRLSSMLDQKILVWLGKLSFSIYLLHLLMIYLVCIPLFNFMLNHSFSYASAVSIASISSIIVTLAVSELYSRYVDQFAIHFSNRFAKLFSSSK